MKFTVPRYSDLSVSAISSSVQHGSTIDSVYVHGGTVVVVMATVVVEIITGAVVSEASVTVGRGDGVGIGVG